MEERVCAIFLQLLPREKRRKHNAERKSFTMRPLITMLNKEIPSKDVRILAERLRIRYRTHKPVRPVRDFYAGPNLVKRDHREWRTTPRLALCLVRNLAAPVRVEPLS